MDEKKVLLSVKNLSVKFRVRGRILTAIRNISLDIYENESIAIVGESGSGKSVFTKTFAGMLDSNGFISDGSVVFNDDELAVTKVKLSSSAISRINSLKKRLDEYSRLEPGAETYKQMLDLKSERERKLGLTEEEEAAIDQSIRDLRFQHTEAGNLKQTLDPKKEKDKLKQINNQMKDLDAQIKCKEKEKENILRKRKADLRADKKYNDFYHMKMATLKAKHSTETNGEISEECSKRNDTIAKEFYLSVARYSLRRREKALSSLLNAAKKAMMMGVDLYDKDVRSNTFGDIVLYAYLTEETFREDGLTPAELHGYNVINMAKIKNPKDWTKIRGYRIATVFQDPMTSLNPIITIGKQITSIIIKHQNCTEAEARDRALELMYKVGIPNAEKRFDDYPFQYSGGMRQRIVIAIALSCQPKILICDEPTTALDVTIQAQILQLLKDLQKEYNYTIVFITHDLGVVANIADRVAVLYGGQVIELGNVEEVFYDPRHPYTWALLSSLPQLAQRDTKLYSITGTPPSLYNKIIGDAFAPRNPYCMKIDTLAEPPMFQVTPTHFAKTWLLDPRAPKTEKPEIIHNIHDKLKLAFNI